MSTASARSGDVHHMCSADILAVLVCHIEAVDAFEKSGEGLSRSGWCSDQRVCASPNGGPAQSLRLGRSVREALGEPVRNRWMPTVPRRLCNLGNI